MLPDGRRDERRLWQFFLLKYFLESILFDVICSDFLHVVPGKAVCAPKSLLEFIDGKDYAKKYAAAAAAQPDPKVCKSFLILQFCNRGMILDIFLFSQILCQVSGKPIINPVLLNMQ